MAEPPDGRARNPRPKPGTTGRAQKPANCASQRCDDCRHTTFRRARSARHALPAKERVPRLRPDDCSATSSTTVRRPASPRRIRSRWSSRRGAAPDDQHRRLRADARGAGSRHAGRGDVPETRRRNFAAGVPSGREGGMKPGSIAIVGAAETTELGVVPHGGNPAACRCRAHAMRDAGPSSLRHRRHCRATQPQCGGALPRHHADLGRRHPRWAGCSFMLHHAAAAHRIGPGCKDRAHHPRREGRSGIGLTRAPRAPGERERELAGQFQLPYGTFRPAHHFTVPVLRYMKTYGLTEEHLATVAVVQREWAAKKSRARRPDARSPRRTCSTPR